MAPKDTVAEREWVHGKEAQAQASSRDRGLSGGVWGGIQREGWGHPGQSSPVCVGGGAVVEQRVSPTAEGPVQPGGPANPARRRGRPDTDRNSQQREMPEGPLWGIGRGPLQSLGGRVGRHVQGSLKAALCVSDRPGAQGARTRLPPSQSPARQGHGLQMDTLLCHSEFLLFVVTPCPPCHRLSRTLTHSSPPSLGEIPSLKETSPL